jgi:hypothetical protein
MKRHSFRTSIFISAMLAASAAFAGADIVKCVDQNGHVTLTDAQCSEGVQTVLVTGAADTPADGSAETASADTAMLPAAPAARRTPIQRIVLAPAQMQHDSWSAHRPSGRMLARDVETLKAARLSMQVLDEASATVRHQRLAGLN